MLIYSYTCVASVSLFVLRRPRDFTLPSTRRGTLYIVYIYEYYVCPCCYGLVCPIFGVPCVIHFSNPALMRHTRLSQVLLRVPDVKKTITITSQGLRFGFWHIHQLYFPLWFLCGPPNSVSAHGSSFAVNKWPVFGLMISRI